MTHDQLSAEYAYFYAIYMIKGRWSEDIILTSPEYAYKYAIDMTKGRWDGEYASLAEKTILTDVYYARL